MATNFEGLGDHDPILAEAMARQGRVKMTADDIRTNITWQIMSAFQKVEREASEASNGGKDFDIYLDHMSKGIAYSDADASEMMKNIFDGETTYVPATGQWYVWNGVYHEQFNSDLVIQWITFAYARGIRWALSRVKERIELEASTQVGRAKAATLAMYTRTHFKEHRAYRDRIHNNSGLSSLGNVVRAKLSVTDDYFVDDMRWLVFLDGVLDLWDLKSRVPHLGDLEEVRSRKLPHDKSRPVWRCIQANLGEVGDGYNLSGPAGETWTRFLQTSLPDAELRKFLATVMGAAVLGESKIKTIPVLIGKKNSGKTIFIDTMDNLLDGYSIQPDTLALNLAVGGPNFEQDRLRGMRFVGISEPNTDRKVDESFVKKYTGGDVLSTRNLHARSVSWKSQGIMCIATNNELKFNFTDKAILERFAYVEFPNQFLDEGEILAKGLDMAYVKDRRMEDMTALEGSADAVLEWVMLGAIEFLNAGYVAIPESIGVAREEMYLESSPVIAWLDAVKKGEWGGVEWVEGLPASHYASPADLFGSFNMWAEVNGFTDVAPETQRTFSSQLIQALGNKPTKSNGVRRYVGLKMVTF